jgi:hypothetical protein
LALFILPAINISRIAELPIPPFRHFRHSAKTSFLAELEIDNFKA